MPKTAEERAFQCHDARRYAPVKQAMLRVHGWDISLLRVNPTGFPATKTRERACQLRFERFCTRSAVLGEPKAKGAVSGSTVEV